MDRKAEAFVAAFGATLFAQWAAQPSRTDRFWEDASFLTRALEDGTAKLPQRKLQAAVRRDLARFVAQLQTLLQQTHRLHVAEQTEKEEETVDETLLLLNEEDVERALATRGTAADAIAASVLAREDAPAARIQHAVTTATTTRAVVALASECVTQLRVVRARRFDDASEREGIEAFYWTQLAAGVHVAASQWCGAKTRGAWSVASSSTRCGEREALRRVLQSLVVADLSTTSVSSYQQQQQPWSAFFRPQQSTVFRSKNLATARAGVYGALLALAVAFPVVYDDEDDASESGNGTSGDSSSSSDDDSDSDSDEDSPSNRRKSRKAAETKKHKQREDCVALAAHVVRQIVLAAKHEEVPVDWYLAVLGAFHGLTKPTRFVYDDDEDDDDEALTTAQQKALHDALAELYGRAFATSAALWTERQHAPLALLEALLCLRHAAEFMRVERKQTVPAVASATTQLVGVALPSAFWKWMAHVKKVFAGEHAVAQAVMKKLSKHKAEKKMANVLMHDSVVTLAELRVLVEQFELFLVAENERAHFVVARAPTSDVQPQDGDANEEDAPDQALFFLDNDGGNKSKKRALANDEAARKRGRTDA